MARGGQYSYDGPYSNGGPPMKGPYNEALYNNRAYGSQTMGPLSGPPPPQFLNDRLTRSVYPDKNNGTIVRGGRVATLKFLAGAQLVIGFILLILGIVCFALGPFNMSMALLTGACVLWCPVGSIATGIVGLFLSRGNTRDFVCVRRGYQVMCLLNAFFFMLLLILATGMVQLRTFDMDDTNIGPEETLLLAFLSTFLQGGLLGGLEMEKMEESDVKGYLSLACLIIAFAIINVLCAVIASSIICCGAPFAIDDPQIIMGPPKRPPTMMPPPPMPPQPREIIVEREPYYVAQEPIYVPRPTPATRPASDLGMVPYSRPHSQNRGRTGDYEDEYLRNYYKKYYEDYERMMEKFKDSRRKHGTIRSKDFDRFFGRSRKSRRDHGRSYDDHSVGYRPHYSTSDF